VFGLFCRKLFIPWSEIEAERGSFFFIPSAKLWFGMPPCGVLGVRAELADRLSAASGVKWPEPGPIEPASGSEALIAVAKEWLVATVLASLFFIVAPRLLAPSGDAPPIPLAIGFPAVVFGIGAVFRFLARRRK
jgi:hypothetical protein